MKILNCLVIIFCLNMLGCGTVPQSRSHFIELMKEESGIGPFKRLAFSKTVTNDFTSAVNNIDDKLAGCVPGGYQSVSMRGSSMSTLTVSNNNRVNIISDGFAEITIQQYHSATVMQSDGGFYLLAANVSRLDQSSVNIDFYTGSHYTAISDAIEFWAKGSEKCHGIGGNP